MSNDETPRVLLAVLVYNGGPFVRECLSTVSKALEKAPDADALVLDDCSEPAFSDSIGKLSASLGLSYYRSPRNLGIPRNMNLALLRATRAGYDYVVLINSDLLLPANFVVSMVQAAKSDPRIASVTAWSNNVSSFSLPSRDAQLHLANPRTVDWISSALSAKFSGQTMELPSAVGFCMLISAGAIAQTGLLDPIFGRGYCEEIDWSLRAKAAGYRNVLAPSVFVYHTGSGSTRAAGLLGAGEATVPGNEAIIDRRYPDFRPQVQEFTASGQLTRLIEAATRQVIEEGARDSGYLVDATWLPREERQSERAHFRVDPEGQRPWAIGNYLGFAMERYLNGGGIIQRLEEWIGCPPSMVRAFDRGDATHLLLTEARSRGIPVFDGRAYPELALAEQK